jgi:hypothetical protein
LGKRRIEVYQEKNKNAGFNLFIRFRKRYVEYFERLSKERKNSFWFNQISLLKIKYKVRKEIKREIIIK